MEKQILEKFRGNDLHEVACYLLMYFPYDEELCSYTSEWNEELYTNEYPLVSGGMWTGLINLQTRKLLNWKREYGNMFLQAKVRDEGTYFLLDKDQKPFCKLVGYVPNGLIPDEYGFGDYVRLRINDDGFIENWLVNPNFSEFLEDADYVSKIDNWVHEPSILEETTEYTYSQIMKTLLRLPKHLQLDIGKALIANASEGFEDDEK